MKNLNWLLLSLFTLISNLITAQTADEIINNYLENTGGKKNWLAIKAIKFEGLLKIPSQGLEIPFEGIETTDGKLMMKGTFQGMNLVFQAFDGINFWSTNMQSMKAEVSDSEQLENHKRSIGEFPDPFLRYKENGYKVEYLGEDVLDGTKVYKIKLTTKPKLLNGVETEDVSIYYFDQDSYVIIMDEEKELSGPAAGITTQSILSDYQEVNGLYFPFTQEAKSNGQTIQIISFEKLTIDPSFETTYFSMPN